MNLYIFKFRSGSVFSIPAKNKMSAVQIVAQSYDNLFESEPFEVFMVTTELKDNGIPKDLDLENLKVKYIINEEE